MFKLLFITVASPHPIGGVKVVYQFCERLLELGIECEIIHTDDPSASISWMKYDVKIRRSLVVDPNTDFVIIPEGAACHFAKNCKEQNIKYAIFVQNGYQIYNDIEYYTRDEIEDAYRNASLILSISEDTTNVIKMVYPFVSNKILRVHPLINKNIFFKGTNKEPIITYMPRKLNVHAHLVRYILEKKVPKNWKFIEINNMPELEVSEVFRRSSIFLSFSNLEGFGLPPLEAAVSGNLVVGYSGQGGNEYFLPPIFNKIENGDLINFTNTVMQAITLVESGFIQSADFQSGIDVIDSTYNEFLHAQSLLSLASHAANAINSNQI